MKILVTGGAGFIGSAVVRRAIRDGHQVVNLDALTYSANLENVAGLADDPNYAFEHVDVCDRPKLEAVLMVMCGTVELVTALIILAPSLMIPPCS